MENRGKEKHEVIDIGATQREAESPHTKRVINSCY